MYRSATMLVLLVGAFACTAAEGDGLRARSAGHGSSPFANRRLVGPCTKNLAATAAQGLLARVRREDVAQPLSRVAVMANP